MNDDEALAEVRRILSEGWCKGALHRDMAGQQTQGFAANRASSCLLGGIELVAADEMQSERLRRRVTRGIAKLTGGDMVSVPGFNDALNTTQEDVLLAVKYAETECPPTSSQG
jgi:hypothetical protein